MEGKRAIRSCTLELITIKAAEKRGTGEFTTMQLLQDVLVMLEDCKKLEVSFDRYYDSTDFSRSELVSEAWVFPIYVICQKPRISVRSTGCFQLEFLSETKSDSFPLVKISAN